MSIIPFRVLTAYRISATNNSRKFNGTTYLEAEDPHVQLIHLDDGNQLKAIFQIIFTPEELMLNETFCRGITKVIARKYEFINSKNDL